MGLQSVARALRVYGRGTSVPYSGLVPEQIPNFATENIRVALSSSYFTYLYNYTTEIRIRALGMQVRIERGLHMQDIAIYIHILATSCFASKVAIVCIPIEDRDRQYNRCFGNNKDVKGNRYGNNKLSKTKTACQNGTP
jgi:hypothetical protein